MRKFQSKFAANFSCGSALRLCGNLYGGGTGATPFRPVLNGGNFMADITPIQPGRGRKTNRDRLSSMTDEELAEWLDGMQSRAYDVGTRLEG